jgi:hypothetical protein
LAYFIIFYLFINFFIVVLGGGTLWHLQKFLQSIKRICWLILDGKKPLQKINELKKEQNLEEL